MLLHEQLQLSIYLGVRHSALPLPERRGTRAMLCAATRRRFTKTYLLSVYAIVVGVGCAESYHYLPRVDERKLLQDLKQTLWYRLLSIVVVAFLFTNVYILV